MNEALVAAALIGTSRQPDPPWATGTPIDDLVAAAAGQSVERAILLAAGAADLYRRAGLRPSAPVALPPVCPPETRPELERRGAELLADLLAGRQPIPSWADLAESNYVGLSPADLTALLPEAFRLVAGLGCRLPHRLLVQALDLKLAAARAAVLPVLGERGRWLARFNPAWRWAAGSPTGDCTGSLDQAERLWQEGTPAQRAATLVRLRASAPDTAREWLAETWKGEKADVRQEFVSALRTNLSSDDEPFLELALRDRSDKVRDCAADLLLALPASGLRARLCTLAGTCLAYQPPARGLHGLRRKLGVGRQHGTLDVQLPAGEGIDWASLGIGKPPPETAGQGRGAWYLSRLLARIPPSHWSSRFGAAPEDLLAAAQAGDWSQVLVEAWSHAAILFGEQAWIEVFLRRWPALFARNAREDGARQVACGLLAALPPSLASQERGRLLSSGDTPSIHLAVEALTGQDAPWQEVESRAYVDLVGTLPQRIPEAARFNGDPWMRAIQQSLPVAACRLSPDSLGRVPRRWDLPDHLRQSPWARALAVFSDTVNLRRHIRRTLAGSGDRPIECRD